MEICPEQMGRQTDWIIFEHAHGFGGTRAFKGVEEAGHGHGDQPNVDDARLLLCHGGECDGEGPWMVVR